MEKKKAFLLLAFGGADSIDSVEPFIRNVLKGRPVTPELVEKIKERYKLIGGKSPLLDLTRAQAESIRAVIARQGLDYKAYVGMRYWDPFIKDTLRQMKEDGVTDAVAVIMAPFVSLVATGAYNSDVEGALAEQGKTPSVVVTPSFHLKTQFLETVAGNVKKELASFKDPKDALVIFSSHSLPWVGLEGDPYEMLVNQSVSEIVKRIGVKIDYKVAFQSKGAGPREWLGPATEDVIQGAKKMGKNGVVVVPVGFVADHIETLYDIDILFKGIAESSGLVFRRSASLNTNPAFMELLASTIISHSERRQ
ncbi:MAG: ferrochelatase [Deltaproteobacteria bacterium GWC2_56_8]|nr:MAG: ferrochelatase [Deltaproteobacteria bacterium GWB2_55_19]OGP33183.1 MAG: ferrochelatase [Deltaproteobacteria bacterium GWC2_56_8]HAO92588.1 ferrochelatase [Deltaproteobacteria bacterium]